MLLLSHHTCHQPVILKEKKNQGYLIGANHSSGSSVLPPRDSCYLCHVAEPQPFSLEKHLVSGSIATEKDVGAKLGCYQGEDGIKHKENAQLVSCYIHVCVYT